MAPPELFIDSSAWLPYVYPGRAEAERALHRLVLATIGHLLRTGARVVTSNLVVAETHQLLLLRDRRATALQFLHAVLGPGLEVVWSTADLERRALREWIEPFDDQDFSLTDAVSFTVMRDRGIRQALALDRHFAIAGFELLPPRGRR
ncbi:MAG: type II toxin-antitoxin system VapC family toxin [Gemmatimonadales bacterium]